MSPATPEHFGRYVLTRRIGAGGMAEVFHARSEGSRGVGKELVIKRIQPEHTADPEFVEMFVDEARVALRLQHDSVVQVFDFGEIDGRFFIAMEHIDGLSVIQLARELAGQGRLMPTGCALYIAHRVASGLEYCHTLRGEDDRPLDLVHRDICPANVLLSRRGDVKITDFGIARSAIRTFSTQGPTPKGHVAYMSPEQARGEEVGPTSDLFSLGVMLHELLTGRRLFRHPTGSGTLRRVLQGEILPPSALNAELTPEIDALVMGLLQRDPAQRTQSAAALLAALTPLLPAPQGQLRRELAALVSRQVSAPVVIGSASSPTILQDETTELSRPTGWRWLLLAGGLVVGVAVIMAVIALSRAPVAADPVAVAPVAADPVAVAPVTEPVAEPVAVEPILAEPILAEPAVVAPVETAPVAPEPVAQPAAAPEPVAQPAVAPVARPEPAQPVAQPAAAPSADPTRPVAVRIVLEGGWGFITVDGRALRRKRGEDATAALSPGTHTVQVRRSSDARVFSRQIEVLPGEPLEVSFDLSQ